MKPIHYIRFIAMTMSPALAFSGVRAQGLYLSPGINWVAKGSPRLVLNNASLTNDGNFSADSSIVLFTGDSSASHSFIGGYIPVSFYNLTISKSSDDVQLNNNAVVTGTITLDSGNLQLNNYTLDLGNSGSIARERDNSCITGNRGGTIKITAVLNAPHAINPGNIGVELTSQANFGSTVITRGHLQLTNSSGETSIQRWFDIEPATNPNAPASLRFFYLDGELAGKDRNALVLFSSKEGDDNWSIGGKDASDQIAGWILKNNIGQGRRFTLAMGSANSKPGSAITSLQIYPNPSHDMFCVQIVSEGEGNGVAQLYDVSGQLLEAKRVYWQTGVTTINWNISKYAAGIYYLSIGNLVGGTTNIVKQ
jgi:Secretion system C-terminal sorting domain